MSREFPDWVNPFKAADGNRRYSGTIALHRMARLRPLLASDEGSVRFEAVFSRDALELATVRLSVVADLTLLCQASLEPYSEPVSRSSQLVVTEGPEQDEGLPEDYEPARVEDGQLVFLELVQDELILAIPQVPRKPGLGDVVYSTDPEADAAAAPAEHNRPFASLDALLKGGRNDSNTC
jgi:uncharacterized protein